jgi:type I restriction enzyme, R subunit
MNELHLQDKFLIPFLTDNVSGLGYREVKANTITSNLIIEEDLKEFLKKSELNERNYEKLLRKFKNNEDKLIKGLVSFLEERIKNYRNMALFINDNKSITFEGLKLYLFYASGNEMSEMHEDELFDQNIFSVVQELPYKYEYQGTQIFSFRPDISFFVNGMFLGFSELKSNYNNQNANKNGRGKVIKDYKEAVLEYLKISESNDINQNIRKDFLKIFEKAIHITTTDIEDTYIIRDLSTNFEEIKNIQNDSRVNFDSYEVRVKKSFRSYPLLNKDADKADKMKEVFTALYSKKMIEKEILYYNYIEREVVVQGGEKSLKNAKGWLISPRPKQKFGTDKIMSKLDEFLEHEDDDNYFINKLEKELTGFRMGEGAKKDLIEKRLAYQNNKNIYSLLLQYAAGFGKSNIIGWSALQLKDFKKDGQFVYDKIMLIVDRVQLRDQLDTKMFNMNIDNSMFVEANNKKTFIEALSSDKRIIIVNLQKFTDIKDVLNKKAVDKLSTSRVVFLIDEIHRSQSGAQNEEMISLFDELQARFDRNESYIGNKKKKNLIIGFTATPSDHTLARFGEYNKYAESEKIWVPFDSYTMKEAIEDGYILNPLKGIVPVSAKMYYELPDDLTEGMSDKEKEYRIIKKKVYDNSERIDAIAKFVVDRLVQTTYKKIRGQAKAMLATSSIKNAIKYKEAIEKHYAEKMENESHSRFKDAPIFIVYSGGGQDQSRSSYYNSGLTETKVLQKFALCKNGLMIVVDKLQTGYDEPKLHTLFLDKEINGINAIQTISRVNRTMKHKNECKIIDFSYKNVNVNNIKKAFEHFSDVVVSDFDPFGELKLLNNIFEELKKDEIYRDLFGFFIKIQEENNVEKFLELENSFGKYIRSNPDKSKKLKKLINQYFHIINLIEYVIEFDKKYVKFLFLEFWKRFNYEYNNINKSDEIKDDVEIYFDNKIGIVEPLEEKIKKDKKGKGDSNSLGKKNKYNILDIIEKKNEAEKLIEQLIVDFEKKIDMFFDYIPGSENGKNFMAKMNDSRFDEEEVLGDFEKIYRRFTILNKKELGEFFIRETKDILDKMYEDFEEVILKNNV